MCCQYTFAPGSDFYQRFGIENRLESLAQKYSVFPGQEIPVIVNNGVNLAWIMKWGLIPFWAKDRRIGEKMFNARAESVTEKVSFKRSFMNKRCLVPANQFGEWKQVGTKKVPYFFGLEERPLFAFAGLYDVWEEPVSGREIYSYTIITTESSGVVREVHDRMPVILEKKNEDLWLKPSASIIELKTLLRPSKEEAISIAR